MHTVGKSTSVVDWLLVFLAFSCAGWICEVLFEYAFARRFVNRGFLFGPWVPLYGVGMLLMRLPLRRLEQRSPGWSTPAMMHAFFLAALVATLLEYVTGLGMELLFGQRWWDYSGYRMNLHGRVCLLTSLLFGVGGTLGVWWLLPALFQHLDRLSVRTKFTLAGLGTGLMTLDLSMTLWRL